MANEGARRSRRGGKKREGAGNSTRTYIPGSWLLLRDILPIFVGFFKGRDISSLGINMHRLVNIQRIPRQARESPGIRRGAPLWTSPLGQIDPTWKRTSTTGERCRGRRVFRADCGPFEKRLLEAHFARGIIADSVWSTPLIFSSPLDANGKICLDFFGSLLSAVFTGFLAFN